MELETQLNGIKQLIQKQGLNILYALAVLVVGGFLVHWALKLLFRKERLSRIDPMLSGFIRALVKFVLYALVILTAIGVMGIPLTSVLTIVASAGVAISLAMQGALSNFVGGVMILLLKPFNAGDYVRVGDTEGTIKTIGMIYTELVTADNRHVSMPNSSLTNAAITNYTREGTRRMDVNFSVAYAADLDQACATIREVVRHTEGILEEPAPEVMLTACEDSSLTVTARLWCKPSDYWPIYYGVLRRGKLALDRAQIEIPFPQMDVHIR